MKKSKEEWDSILDDLENYEGTLDEFSKLKGLSRSCLYKYRKIRNTNIKTSESEPEITFTKIDIKKEKQEEIIEKENFKEVDNSKNTTITIKIGKAKMILDSADKSTLSFILKELSLIC